MIFCGTLWILVSLRRLSYGVFSEDEADTEFGVEAF